MNIWWLSLCFWYCIVSIDLESSNQWIHLHCHGCISMVLGSTTLANNLQIIPPFAHLFYLLSLWLPLGLQFRSGCRIPFWLCWLWFSKILWGSLQQFPIGTGWLFQAVGNCSFCCFVCSFENSVGWDWQCWCMPFEGYWCENVLWLCLIISVVHNIPDQVIPLQQLWEKGVWDCYFPCITSNHIWFRNYFPL